MLHQLTRHILTINILFSNYFILLEIHNSTYSNINFTSTFSGSKKERSHTLKKE